MKVEFVIRIVVEPDHPGFHAFCPALKGLHTCGDTREEALSNARDAAKAYLLSLMKHHEPFPKGVVVKRIEAPTAASRGSSSRLEVALA